MSHFSRKKHDVSPPPANALTSQSTRQPRPVCTWSAHAPQSGPSPSLSSLLRDAHTVTATATAAGELFLFGGDVRRVNNGVYVFSTRDFSTTLLQTSGELPTRAAHGATLVGTALLMCGDKTNIGDQNLLNHDSLYLLNLGTSDLLMSSPTPADHSFALQYRESGPAFWSMVLGPMIVTTQP